MKSSKKISGNQVDLSSKADLVGGKVPAAQLPSYVDDVLEFANLASFPATGESGKIYVALDTNLQYRWSGSGYVQIGGSNYNLSNWIVNRFFHQNSVQGNLIGSAISGGTYSASGLVSEDNFLTQSGFVIQSSTNANSGYQFLTTSGIIKPIDNFAIYGTFRLHQSSRDNVVRIGYGVFGNNNIRLEIATDAVRLVCASNSVSTATATETLLPNLFYTFLIVKVSNSLVNMKIKRTSDGTIVFDKNITTNIPSNSLSTVGIYAVITTAGASNGIIQVSDLSFGLKPNFLNDF